MSEELKPCPFCGASAYIQSADNEKQFFAACSQCFCDVGEGYDRDAMPDHQFATEDAAIAAWNTRKSDLVVEDLSMLIRMMVTKHRRGKLDEEYCQKAIDYLQRKGLQGSVLRAI